MGKERGKVNPERVRQRFSREFKLEAVRLLEQGEKPATQLAMELGTQRQQTSPAKDVRWPDSNFSGFRF